MATKWKKSKCAVSFLCFVLGVSLLITSGALILRGTFMGGWSLVREALTSDYRDTGRFRGVLSYRLWYCLNSAAGLEEDMEEMRTLFGGRNLLYRIDRDGRTLAANEPGLAPGRELPKGYHFLLWFDGETVQIWKDGQEIDVYGDGYYRPEKGNWYLPGYTNIPLEDFVGNNWQADFSTGAPLAHSTAPGTGSASAGTADVSGVTICLAAAEEPVYYADTGWGDPLYSIVQDRRDSRIVLLLLALIPAAGVVLAVLYVVWRKPKAQADRGIAWVCGKIWLEIKLALLVPLCILLWQSSLGLFSLIFAYHSVHFEVVFLFPAVWCCYLYVNDLRYNGLDFFRSSFCAACARLFRSQGLKYPVQQRLERQARWQFLAAIPFMAGSGVFALLLPTLFGVFRRSGWPWLIFWVLLCLAGLALIAVQVLFLRKSRQNAADLGVLLDRIQAARDGDLSKAAPLPRDSDLLLAADALDGLEAGMRAAVAEQTRSERMKVELISNVSHDLKTPLTSIISYTELLSQEEDLPEHVKDYIRILSKKAQRLSAMVRDVFEVSKAASGSLSVRLERLDLGKLLRQTLADMGEAIDRSGLSLKTQLPEEAVPVTADGDRLYRVFQNLIQNALQYALPGSRVYLTLRAVDGMAAASLKNISRDELAPGVDFTERFVRGDESRTDGGSGLGLSIARTFTEACGGTFSVETDADLFTAVVALPLAPAETERRDAE